MMISSQENFKNERKFYDRKYLRKKIVGKGNAPITFSCKSLHDDCDHFNKRGRENFSINLALFW